MNANQTTEDEMTNQIPEQIQADLDAGATVVASVSGGKDSTAACLLLKEMGIPFTAIHMDTGWELKPAYRYVRDVLPDVIGEITFLRREVDLPPDVEEIAREFEARLEVEYSSMVRLALKKPLLPSRVARWCTEKLKVEVAKAYFDAMDADPINVVGIRAEESKRRSTYPEVEESRSIGCTVWRPILRWKLVDVIDIHQRHGVSPCSLYFAPLNAMRVGCGPCIFATKAEIRGLATHFPERFAILRDLERVVTRLRREKFEALGEEYQNQYETWFYGKGGAGPTPIDQVIEWATAEHRNQIELFTADQNQGGCMRWGMCDIPTE